MMTNINAGLGKTIFFNLILRIFVLIITCLLLIFLVNFVIGKEMVFTLVVGSALVDSMARAIESGGDHAAAIAAASGLLAVIRQGIDSIAS